MTTIPTDFSWVSFGLDDVEVGEDLRNVLQLLERVDQLEVTGAVQDVPSEPTVFTARLVEPDGPNCFLLTGRFDGVGDEVQVRLRYITDNYYPDDPNGK